MLLTRKMKNTTTWTFDWRPALARSRGRIRIIEAPVVPIQEASIVPINRITVLTAGVPASLPRMTIPPPAVKSPQSRMMNGM